MTQNISIAKVIADLNKLQIPATVDSIVDVSGYNKLTVVDTLARNLPLLIVTQAGPDATYVLQSESFQVQGARANGSLMEYMTPEDIVPYDPNNTNVNYFNGRYRIVTYAAPDVVPGNHNTSNYQNADSAIYNLQQTLPQTRNDMADINQVAVQYADTTGNQYGDAVITGFEWPITNYNNNSALIGSEPQVHQGLVEVVLAELKKDGFKLLSDLPTIYDVWVD